MKIYFTRHGETLWNTLGKMQGRQNSDLTEKGLSNAKKLGLALNNIDFDVVYCSPSGRAIQTATAIIGDRDIELIKNDNLLEMNFGIWEGMTHDEVGELYPVEKHNFWNIPENYETMGGETFEEILSRVRTFLTEIITNPNLETVLLVSHAITTKTIYAVLNDCELSEFWNSPFVSDTCLSIVEIKDGQISFLLECDTNHLNS